MNIIQYIVIYLAIAIPLYLLRELWYGHKRKRMAGWINTKQTWRQLTTTLYRPDISDETRDIVNVFVRQLTGDVEKKKKKLLKHFYDHNALLLDTEVELPFHITDEKVYMGIALLKELFYETYGASFQGEGYLNTSAASFTVVAPNGIEVRLNDQSSLQEILKHLDEGDLKEYEIPIGCKVVTRLSIVTPWTLPFYKHHSFKAI